MSSSPPVRSVVRALEILRAMNVRAVTTIDALHVETRIPKPTIVRLLQTLEGQGFVQHAPQHGAYFLKSAVRQLSSGYHSEPAVVEASAQVLDEATVRIKWPLAVAVLDRYAMVVRYSTIPLSPLALRHSTINMRLSLVSRAMGRAYLAFCTPDEQAAILNELRHSNDPEDQAAAREPEIRDALEAVRTARYALRHPSAKSDSNTIAVPIFNRDGVAASLGMTFFASAMSTGQALERYLADVAEMGEKISARLQQLQVEPVA